VELQVADGDDWMEMLRKTVSPVKADRQALRARQELFSRRDKDSVSLAAQPKVPSFIDRLHDVASPANMAGLRKESGMGAGLGAVSDLDDGRGFSNSIDLMRSLFDDARTANTGRHVGAMSATPSVHGFVKVGLLPG
jgi:nuclear pore complex protein Nup98-Nup96